MQAIDLKGRMRTTRRELLMLLVASLTCVIVLTVGIATPPSATTLAGLTLQQLLMIALAGVATVAAILLVWHTVTTSRRQTMRAFEESAELKRNLMTAEAVIKSEPQVLVHWEQGQGPSVVAKTLAGVAGLPQHDAEILKFGAWLEPRAANDLKQGLDSLFADGRAFNAILRTKAGGHVEADGRAAGGRAVLRFRDIAGYKQDLVRIITQHQRLTRDIRAAHAILDALPMPVWIKDTEGQTTWVNAAYARSVDAQGPQEAIERKVELLESRQREAMQKALAKDRTYRKRVHLIVGNERKPHDILAQRLDDATAAAAIDVTAVERAKGELDRQVAAYDRTLDRVATAVAIFNREQRLVFFNAAYRELWQIDVDWLQTGPTDGAVLDRLRELGRLPEVVDYREWRTRVLSSYKSSAGLEDWWHLPDGRVVHVMAEQRPDGGVTYLYDDQTERLGLESRYNALISVQRETLDNLKEGVAVFATDGRLKLFNSAFAAIWKLSRRTLAESPHISEIASQARVLYDDPPTWAALARTVTSFADEREPLDGQMLRPDGSVIDFASTPLPDGATLLTFADVTDARRYERALVERNEALVAADRLKNQFIGHVSYELRTPLNSIIGFSELLADPHFGPLNDKQLEYVNDISASSKTLLAIIDDILDLATIDAGALELKLEPVSVQQLIDTAIDGIRERAARARLTLDIAVADDVSRFIADEARVRQVLYNLLSNAVGFSKPGGTVHLSCWREGAKIVFVVEDQGVGIPRDQQTRVFDRFESRSQGSKHRGAGLGLSIVRSLVDLHGGSMTLDSEPGRGTRVTVSFPEAGLEQRKLDAAAADQPRLDRGAGGRA